MGNLGSMASFQALLADQSSAAGDIDSTIGSFKRLYAARKSHRSVLDQFKPLCKKLDVFISEMSVDPTDLDDARSMLSLLKSLSNDNNVAIQNSPLKVSKDHISMLNERVSFIAEFYEFWIETEESISTPDAECLTLEEL